MRYADAGAHRRRPSGATLVREPTLGLRGRPDYVLEYGAPNERRLHPLEVKPTRRSQRVYESDELQVGAYLIALRGTVGARAGSTGYVRYAAGTRVDPPVLERRVRDTIALIRRGRRAPQPRRTRTVRWLRDARSRRRALSPRRYVSPCRYRFACLTKPSRVRFSSTRPTRRGTSCRREGELYMVPLH